MAILQRLKTRISLESAAALLVIAFGLVLRLRQYLLNLSFWVDEAMLALNIVNRNFAELVRPLDYDQGAPLGFLWIVKLVEGLLGNHEYSLRLFTFLAGCLALLLLWLLARQLIQPVGVVFALLVLASSRYLVSYTAQVKQYAVDVCIALLLCMLGQSLLRKELTKKDYWLLAILGALSIWMSHAAVFTLGGLGLVLIATAALKKDWRSAAYHALVAGFWMLNFAALYFIQYRSLAANAYLTNFWADYFMPLSVSAPAWTFERLAGLLYNPGGLAISVPSVVIMLLFFAGLFSLIWSKKSWAWMFALSLVFTLAASSLDKYPFGGRMGMFAVPGLLICTGEGIELLRRLFGSRQVAGTLIAVALAGYLAYAPVSFSIELAIKPKVSENIAPTMAFLKANYRPGDVIYLYRTSIPAYRYYAPLYKLDEAQVFIGNDFSLNRTGYESEMNQFKGKKRVWLLFSHLTDYDYVDDRDYIVNYANQIGEKKREFIDPGTAINLFLYDFTP
jgi:hypothetical protein